MLIHSARAVNPTRSRAPRSRRARPRRWAHSLAAARAAATAPLARRRGESRGPAARGRGAARATQEPKGPREEALTECRTMNDHSFMPTLLRAAAAAPRASEERARALPGV